MDLLSSLNDRQREAVTTTDGPVLIVAGAGTGKTMALTYRIAYLIQEKKVDPRQILAVTFTNKAAGEMKSRIEQLLSDSGVLEQQGLPTVGTFHSVCVQILRREIQHMGYESAFAIYDSDDSLAMVKRVMKDLQISEKNFNPKAIRGAISSAKNILQTVEDVQRSAMNAFQQKVGQVYEYYQKALVNAAALDFDDIIMKTIELFEQYPQILEKYQYRWKYIHVDEYQDTNTAQYRLIQMLAKAHHNLCVVGDPDQNIYSWRGADITNILNFTGEYKDAKVIKMEQNYRSTPDILGGAEAIIIHNSARIDKKLWTERSAGEKIQLVDVDDERSESEYVLRVIRQASRKLRDHVVLYRTHAQSRVMEEACLRAGIPYKVIGGVKFYARKEIKDIVAYLRLIHNPRDEASLIRIINTPARQIGNKTMETLQLEASQRGSSMWEALEGKDGKLQKFVELIKGLQEFAHQFPVGTLIREVIHRTGYDRMLLEEKEVGQARLENTQELITVAQKYDGLELGIGLSTFLEEVALVSDTDELQGSDDYLTLMTVHGAKGLEYPHVYVIGLEEGVFPHSRASFDPEQMEEERRLMYVAMTRAKETLHLLWARRRMLFGETQYNPPSSFLRTIPEQFTDGESQAQKGEETMVARIRGLGDREEVVFSDDVPQFMRQVGGAFDRAERESFAEGDIVEHKAFGKGIIRTLKGDIAEIQFESTGLKKIALNVAPVRKI